jgi:hypothetical protein
VTNEAHSQSAKDSEHSVDEAHTGSSPAKDRESHPESGAAGSERSRTTTQTGLAPANGAEHPVEPAAGDEDESGVSSGSDEAAEIDAAARGVAQEANGGPDAVESAEVDAAVRGAASNPALVLSQPPAADEPAPHEQVAPPIAARSSELPTREPLPTHRGSAQPAQQAAGPLPDRIIDLEAADRFAASIRPSWADAPAMIQPPPNAIGAVDGAARVIRHAARTDLATPLRKRRGSAFAILAGCLLAVGVVLYLGISSSTIDHSSQRGLSANDHVSGPHVLKPAPEPVETTVQPAREPQAAQPQPTAAEPTDPNQPSPPSPEATGPAANPAEPERTAAETPELKEPSFAAEQPEAQAAAAAAPAAPVTEPAQLGAAPAEPASTAQPTTEQQPSTLPPAQPAAAAAAAEAAPSTQLTAPPQPSAANAAAPAKPAEKPSQPSAAAPPALKPLPGGPVDRSKAFLSLAAYPPNTRLRLDGALVENPYRVKLPKLTKHRIDAAAPGYAPESHTLRIEADVELMISLKREQARDVKADPYAAPQRRSTTAAQGTAPASAKHDRGAGFVAENPY